ncbi:glycosyltransferase [Dactylosporangium matsuzakiense]|uniref:Glycosyl transferase n=1 Tax=Dactylosporangium matsuzakiense TaxID=53360 RepID=A0A9W6NN57_9ACTN|nr:glycosyltransferase [Dactylosporangium matsuzakiense]UWZ44911.1 glycosyltransferase [Dactylosporangium matsuzakiense]GLL03610.1 glycosyl transferase [Dactylosporangium matsuzakiense]
MKVVVAHNRYASGQPSGENVIVDAEIAQLGAAGVTVLPFLRSSDEIGTFSKAQKVLLPLAPIRGGDSQRALATLLEREKPDVLHLHNPYPLLSPAVVKTAHAHGVPVVHTVHNYRQVCAPGLYFRDGHICTECRGKTFPTPAVAHACYRGSKAQSAVMAATLAYHRSTWKQVDRFIALTDRIATHLVDFGIPAERITVKPNGIPDTGAANAPGDGFLFAGRLSPEKGLALVLDAWSRHDDGALGPLRIAGDGELRPRAEAAAATRSDVTYLGPLDNAGVRAEIARAACVIAASTWHDVLPTIILEALSGGRPVLVTDRGGMPYLTGNAGWVVEPEPAALADGLAKARAGAVALAPVARARYESEFAPDVLTERLIEVYRTVAGRG